MQVEQARMLQDILIKCARSLKSYVMYTIENKTPSQCNILNKNTSGNTIFFQPKLTINAPSDQYEQEANAMAERVIRMPINDQPFFSPKPLSISHVQCKFGHYEEEEKLQKKAVRSSSTEITSPPIVHDVINSGGQPLDKDIRSFMESKFGYDFSNVLIHDDVKAHQSSKDIHALAYTYGKDIVFGRGQYQPETYNGKQLLAHELVHVIQQQNGTAIQRKEDERVTLARERLEDDIDDFQRAYHLTYVFAGFNEKQKEPIKAVKAGDAIRVTVGQSYMDEGDEDTRKAWIKTEIVDRFVKVDRFEDVAKDPTHSKLHEINPPYAVGSYCALNCPATAASLAEYLKSGTINPAYCNPVAEKDKGYGFDVSMNTFTKSFTWKQAEAVIKGLLKKHGDFAVIEATRSAEQMKKYGLAKNHYFTVVNVKGTLFAIDAFGEGIVKDDLDRYIEVNIIATSYRLVKGAFKVKPVLLK